MPDNPYQSPRTELSDTGKDVSLEVAEETSSEYLERKRAAWSFLFVGLGTTALLVLSLYQSFAAEIFRPERMVEGSLCHLLLSCVFFATSYSYFYPSPHAKRLKILSVGACLILVVFYTWRLFGD